MAILIDAPYRLLPEVVARANRSAVTLTVPTAAETAANVNRFFSRIFLSGEFMDAAILRSAKTNVKGIVCVPRFAPKIPWAETCPMPRKTGGRAIPLSVKQALGRELNRIRT